MAMMMMMTVNDVRCSAVDFKIIAVRFFVRVVCKAAGHVTAAAMNGTDESSPFFCPERASFKPPLSQTAVQTS